MREMGNGDSVIGHNRVSVVDGQGIRMKHGDVWWTSLEWIRVNGREDVVSFVWWKCENGMISCVEVRRTYHSPPFFNYDCPQSCDHRKWASCDADHMRSCAMSLDINAMRPEVSDRNSRETDRRKWNIMEVQGSSRKPGNCRLGFDQHREMVKSAKMRDLSQNRDWSVRR